ncbi:unnamed protein product [Mycena citricolor]|uniref:Uncharacterized protein n=1 Tax=Mycena citricolor TaxID=2018698 RepID=A0AAD2HZM0_9AGAR|nr:unnamed protein product [Mycena citricolor]
MLGKGSDRMTCLVMSGRGITAVLFVRAWVQDEDSAQLRDFGRVIPETSGNSRCLALHAIGRQIRSLKARSLTFDSDEGGIGQRGSSGSSIVRRVEVAVECDPWRYHRRNRLGHVRTKNGWAAWVILPGVQTLRSRGG